MRLLVTGGWDFGDREYVFAALNLIHERNPIELVIIEGATRSGVASLADAWALESGIAVTNPSPAEIFDTVLDGIAAFPGGRTAGAWVNLAIKAGIPLWDLRNP